MKRTIEVEWDSTKKVYQHLQQVKRRYDRLRRTNRASFLKDITNQVFGNFTAQWPAGFSGQHTLWLCSCSCGNIRVVRADSLRNGQSQSCGCIRGHGHTRSRNGLHSPTYTSWRAMLQRCGNPKAINYPEYGGRGIRVCEQWKSSFKVFLHDMGERPEGQTLDRIEVNGNYEPSNCRWATREEQDANRRHHHGA